MKQTPTSQQGFSLIELLIVVAIIGIIAAVAIPYLQQARQAAKSSSAISSMRAIHSAQSSFRSAEGRYGSLAELGSAKYIADPSLISGRKSDYTFIITNETTLSYEANADPLVDPQNAYQHYFIDGSGIMRMEVGAAATIASNPLQ
jgi:type IV pilus assembly protein PilA